MPRRDSIPALTGIRFLAAAAVVFHHTGALGLAAYPTAISAFADIGRDGVDVFFVLPGFVIAHNYADWFTGGVERRWEFLWLRAARVLPLHWAVLLLMTPVTLFLASA